MYQHYTLLNKQKYFIQTHTPCIYRFLTFLGIGSSKVYRLQRNKWTKVKNVKLCNGTLLYAEFVKEQLQPRSQKTKLATSECYCKYSLHVIDALRLGDKSLANLRFTER